MIPNKPNIRNAWEAEYLVHSRAFSMTHYNLFGSREVEYYVEYAIEDWEVSLTSARGGALKKEDGVNVKGLPESPPPQTVPDVKMAGQELSTASNKQWFLKELHRITAPQLKAQLCSVKAVQEEISNMSTHPYFPFLSTDSSDIKRLRHVGLFAITKIKAGEIVSDLHGRLVFPSQIARKSTWDSLWDTEKRAEETRVRNLQFLEIPKLTGKGGGFMGAGSGGNSGPMVSPGFEEGRRGLLGPLEMSESGSSHDFDQVEKQTPVVDNSKPFIAPPFVFPHPANLLRLKNGPLVLDCREESGLGINGGDGRYVRSYCGVHDGVDYSAIFGNSDDDVEEKEMIPKGPVDWTEKVCNAELRSFVVVPSSDSEDAISSLDVLGDPLLEYQMQNNRLRLMIVATRDIAVGEEIVLRRLCKDWVGWPCVCGCADLEEDEEDEEEEEVDEEEKDHEVEKEGDKMDVDGEEKENVEGGQVHKKEDKDEKQNPATKVSSKKKKLKPRCPVWSSIMKYEQEAIDRAAEAEEDGAFSMDAVAAAADGGKDLSLFAMPNVLRRRGSASEGQMGDMMDLDSGEDANGRKRRLSDGWYYFWSFCSKTRFFNVTLLLAFTPGYSTKTEMAVPKGGKKHWLKNADPALSGIHFIQVAYC
jgi:hypothetical protein